MSFLGKVVGKFRNAKDSAIYNKYKEIVNKRVEGSNEHTMSSDSFCEAVRGSEISKAIMIANNVLLENYGKSFFEPQKVSAVLLMDGHLLEMATGEGKTLSFALSAALLSQSNERVTICTANDFLAERDCSLTKIFFNNLGIESSFITGASSKEDRKAAYKSKVVYTTIREIAYDHLRDGKAISADDLFLPTKGFLLIDEADNALIDNAASPYYLSKEVEVDESLISAAHDFAAQSKASAEEGENYLLTDEGKDVELSEEGHTKLDRFLKKHQFIKDDESLYATENLYLINLFQSAGRALHIMKDGVDYVIQEGHLRIVDKNSGRILSAVSLNDGLQQIIEHKHKLKLSNETITTDSVATESVVKDFDSFAGMSGTLKVDEDEIMSVYGKACISVPRMTRLSRLDRSDVMFMSNLEKTRYVLELTLKSHKKGRPVLIAATNETEAKGLKSALDELNLSAQLITSESLLNEASMIAMAGTPYKITITTAASGRGTDIILGGNLEHFIENKLFDPKSIEFARKEQEQSRSKVVEAGGLLVIGYGRQLVKKLDLQLRGRSGRQGDVGETIFVMSLEDKALGDYGVKLRGMLSKMNVGAKDMLSHSMISKAFDNSQRSIREMMLKSRKHHAQQAAILESQRKIIYQMRMTLLMSSNWKSDLSNVYGFEISEKISREEAIMIMDTYIEAYNDSVSDLKRSVIFQGYANKSPIQELKRKAFIEYERLMLRINNNLVSS